MQLAVRNLSEQKPDDEKYIHHWEVDEDSEGFDITFNNRDGWQFAKGDAVELSMSVDGANPEYRGTVQDVFGDHVAIEVVYD